MEEDDAILLESLTEYYSPLALALGPPIPIPTADAGDECLPDSLPDLLPSSRSPSRSRDYKQHEPEGIIKAPKIVLTKIKTNAGSLHFILLSKHTVYILLLYIKIK